MFKFLVYLFLIIFIVVINTTIRTSTILTKSPYILFVIDLVIYCFLLNNEYIINIINFLEPLEIFWLNYSMYENQVKFYLIYNLNFLIDYVIFICQVFFIVIITIWARAAGPRFRLDQLASLTWKKLFIYLSLFLIFLLIIIILG